MPISDKTDEEIDSLAYKIANIYGFNSESNDIYDVIRKLGGSVERLLFPDEEQLKGGSLVVRGPNDFVVYLSPVTGSLRNNFTIAHELGHYFLHSGNPCGVVPGKFGNYGDSFVERQANRFAVSFLMPEKRFRAEMAICGETPIFLAGCFKVPLEAVSLRFETLRL